MIIQHSLTTILKDHVTLELESIDRMYLNVYVPQLQTEACAARFFKKHRGAIIASSVLMGRMTDAFRAASNASSSLARPKRGRESFAPKSAATPVATRPIPGSYVPPPW